MTYKANGFIIAKRFAREHDRVFILYTKEYGKIEALAQGVLKLGSKLAGNLELLTKASFLIARGRAFDRIAGIDVENRFPDITANVQKLIVALYGAEILHQMVEPRAPEQNLFFLLEDFFGQLNSLSTKSETRKAVYLAHLFILKISIILGYRSNSRAAKHFFDLLSKGTLGQLLKDPSPRFIPTLVEEFLRGQLSRRPGAQSYIDLLVKNSFQLS